MESKRRYTYIIALLLLSCFAFIAFSGSGINYFSSTKQISTNFKYKSQKTDSVKDFKDNFRQLTFEEENIIVNKGTERPFTGELLNETREGIFHCKRCDAPLYNSSSKFQSHCGWPSFDDELPGAVERKVDKDGIRTEILCKNCGAHLGHVFIGEGFTSKNTRHCVNSLSMIFKPKTENKKMIKKAYFASGCFWGTEYYFHKEPGIVETTVGYMGGHKDNPSYQDVCSNTTGHLETVEVEYDPSKTSYENLVKLFFETHDFTQKNGQGPDIGSQYLSAIFVSDPEDKAIAEKYIKILRDKGYDVATTIKPLSHFWKAEDYHQEYYDKKGGTPYCHTKRKIF
ncbi:bifunctional methionine sulfoxide reductase B/A protein [Porphyromonas pogonae]|uniref:bifunctional methionine sulfoxide reductase B/A protein n=1 Tax=Porphyromonas pogonae TaxID=867595 RepID=UPI002E774494|nr:bifunctional methionine sulfoxide reductase B/A protein [Porphyromonas pogonae]